MEKEEIIELNATFYKIKREYQKYQKQNEDVGFKTYLNTVLNYPVEECKEICRSMDKFYIYLKSLSKEEKMSIFNTN